MRDPELKLPPEPTMQRIFYIDYYPREAVNLLLFKNLYVFASHMSNITCL